MSGRFASLVELAAIRVSPPPVVTPEQFRAIECNHCGDFCEDIRSQHAPECVAAMVDDRSLRDDHRAFLTGLIPVGAVPGGWRFRCRHFSRDANGLGCCGIHATRPSVCRNFPFGGVVRTWPRCAWNVQIVDRDGTVLTALPVERTIPTDAVPDTDIVGGPS